MQILIVEDEIKVAAFLRQALEEEGYRVEAATSGEEGLRLALDSAYDLILLDWRLPDRDGISVCSSLRSAGSKTPILMLTARDTVTDRIVGLDAGADDYLTKPFALGELLARVRALNRRGQAAPSPLLTVADLTLDPVSRRVRRSAREVYLSAREFALLEYLMRHRGQVVTRAMITAHVWDFDFDSGTNVVDVYISYLRNKVDRNQNVKLIQTVRGSGYSLNDSGGSPYVG